MDADEVPKQVLVPAWPVDREVLEEWLSGMRRSKVRIVLPVRGEGRRLLQTVNHNAKEAFLRHKLRRASDFGARSRALAELSDALGLHIPPLRIEAYDISNLGPTDTVGSMVVFEDGLPKRTDYRKFEIKGVPGQDDFASMEEMFRRRFARLSDDRLEDAGPAGSPRKPRRFAYPPSLIVVDGGRGQLGMAEKVLADRGLDIPAIGLAKRLEEVYLPGQPEPGRPGDRGGHHGEARPGPSVRAGRCPGSHHHHGPVRRGAVGGGQELRGPRLLRGGQPAAGPDREDGRAGHHPRRTEPRGHRGRRARGCVLRRAVEGTGGSPRPVDPVSDRVPGGLGRGPPTALRGNPQASPP